MASDNLVAILGGAILGGAILGGAPSRIGIGCPEPREHGLKL
jgi:hypothetical protein